MRGTTSAIASLLAGALICLILVTGCGGTEEANDAPQDPSTEQETQPPDEETTGERSEPKAKSPDDKARDGEATLEIGGDEGTEFSGACAVGNETSALDGQAPESFVYQLDGERLDCEISTSGNLQVVLRSGSTRSVQQISGGTLNLIYENGQISSSLTSSGSGGTSSSSQVVSSSQSSSSSIDISP